jgi:hypothetical protein
MVQAERAERCGEACARCGVRERETGMGVKVCEWLGTLKTRLDGGAL